MYAWIRTYLCEYFNALMNAQQCVGRIVCLNIILMLNLWMNDHFGFKNVLNSNFIFFKQFFSLYCFILYRVRQITFFFWKCFTKNDWIFSQIYFFLFKSTMLPVNNGKYFQWNGCLGWLSSSLHDRFNF